MDTLSEFVKYRIRFERMARERQAERFNAGLADGSFEQWVVEEMLIDFLNENEALKARVKKLEDFLLPQE